MSTGRSAGSATHCCSSKAAMVLLLSSAPYCTEAGGLISDTSPDTPGMEADAPPTEIANQTSSPAIPRTENHSLLRPNTPTLLRQGTAGRSRPDALSHRLREVASPDRRPVLQKCDFSAGLRSAGDGDVKLRDRLPVCLPVLRRHSRLGREDREADRPRLLEQMREAPWLDRPEQSAVAGDGRVYLRDGEPRSSCLHAGARRHPGAEVVDVCLGEEREAGLGPRREADPFGVAERGQPRGERWLGRAEGSDEVGGTLRLGRVRRLRVGDVEREAVLGDALRRNRCICLRVVTEDAPAADGQPARLT